MIDLNQLIGMDFEEAKIVAKNLEITLRVCKIDGKFLAITADACSERLDIALKDNKISELIYLGFFRKYYTKNHELVSKFVEDYISKKYNRWINGRNYIDVENNILIDLFLIDEGKQTPICTLDKDGNVVEDFMDIQRHLNLKEFI